MNEGEYFCVDSFSKKFSFEMSNDAKLAGNVGFLLFNIMDFEWEQKTKAWEWTRKKQKNKKVLKVERE